MGMGMGMGLGLLVVMMACGSASGADDLATKCSAVIQKVIPCLDFAKGKEETPKKQCCDAATSIKESNPECLCYIIEETHKGSPQVKSLGIQEAKLLQLPSVCNVKNASITNCPSKYSPLLTTLGTIHTIVFQLFFRLICFLQLHVHLNFYFTHFL